MIGYWQENSTLRCAYAHQTKAFKSSLTVGENEDAAYTISKPTTRRNPELNMA
jgi:hypothetical protein